MYHENLVTAAHAIATLIELAELQIKVHEHELTLLQSQADTLNHKIESLETLIEDKRGWIEAATEVIDETTNELNSLFNIYPH